MKKRFHGFSLFLVLMLVSVFAGAVLVSAAGGDPAGLVPSPTVVTADSDNTVSIKKDLIFINDAASTVRQPNITYTYTISPVDMSSATASVTDVDGITLPVKSGIAAAITTTTATITFVDTATAPTAEDGVALTSYANFTFNAASTAFPGPGIYRYKIVETTNVDKATVGITEVETYNAERYLDVYVKKTSEDSTTPVIYGYVLFESDESGISFDGHADEPVNIDKKSSGYVNTANANDGFANVDIYRTQDLTVSKTTTGLLADKSNDFPVEITIDLPEPVTAGIKVDVVTAGNGAIDGTEGEDDEAYFTITDAGTFEGTVRNASTITFVGVPEGATASIVETNNTPDTYKVKAVATVDSTDTDVLEEEIVPAGGASSASDDVEMTSTTTIAITNTLETISPTGFITRFAPYILLLVGGILLIVFGRKAVNSTKKKEA